MVCWSSKKLTVLLEDNRVSKRLQATDKETGNLIGKLYTQAQRRHILFKVLRSPQDFYLDWLVRSYPIQSQFIRGGCSAISKTRYDKKHKEIVKYGPVEEQKTPPRSDPKEMDTCELPDSSE